MKKIFIQLSIAIRISLFVFFLFTTSYFIIHKFWFSGFFFILLSTLSLVELIYFSKKYFSYNQKIISALLYDDYSLNIPEINTLKDQQIIKLYQKIKAEKQASFSKEILYQQLLNSISSGFLILKKVENDRKIIFINNYFQKLFDIPKSNSWNKLKKFIPQFSNVLENNNFQEIKSLLDIQIDEEQQQTYIIQNSKTIIEGEEYDIIFLDSVQRVIDSTEKEAWVNVMKIIAHEIINSLTPIYSLASTTKTYFESDELTNEDYDDIRLSLDTIMNRSQHLQTFVEQYRQLTTIPHPIKSNHNLKEIIQEVQQSFKHELEEKKVDFVLSIPDSITIDVDRIQFEQVVINLIKNAIHAIEHIDQKRIEVYCKQTDNRLQIIVHDSGNLIDETILSKIFLPFYTTRKNGAGIGLTLSKTIIEAHKGYLFYKQINGKKEFVISFPITKSNND